MKKKIISPIKKSLNRFKTHARERCIQVLTCSFTRIKKDE